MIAVRPHRIELLTDHTSASGLNILRAAVLRASYLGNVVDYQVRVLDEDLELRIGAPAVPRIHAGEIVTLGLAPDACIPLAADA